MWTDFNNSFAVAFSDELQKSLNKMYHLTYILQLNMLLQYLAKVECSTVQLNSPLFNANVMQIAKSFI